MIKAVIFDMDGVIIDSEPLQSKAHKKFLSKYKVKPIFNDEGLLQTVGLTGDESYLEILNRHGLEIEVEIMKTKVRSIFMKLITKNPKPMVGLIQLLKLLHDNKIKIAVASSRIEKFVIIILSKLEIFDKFAVVVGANEKLKRKPAPDIYLKCAKVLGLSPSVCVAIEDSEIGIASAKAAGIKVIAVPNKYTKSHDFSKADKIVKSLKDIDLKLINSL